MKIYCWFEWLFCSSQMNNETGMLLLKYMVELYVTVRGFAFASSCLEMYKQSQKTTITKQKALQKKLTETDIIIIIMCLFALAVAYLLCTILVLFLDLTTLIVVLA